MLLGMWDDATGVLTVRKPGGQEFKAKQSVVTEGSQVVFGVVTVGNEVHVLTGPKGNNKPSRRVRFSNCCNYLGSRNL